MPPDASVTLRLFEALADAANAGGGWGYEKGKASRLEPTCWALAALDLPPVKYNYAVHRDFLEKCARQGGYLAEDPRWPVNVAFNAQVAFLWLNHRGLAAEHK